MLDADVVVVGSGPGGATVARELARRGERVLVLERGIDHRASRSYGTYFGALRYAERGSFLFTAEGLNVVRPLMLGGATSMYCGCAAPPPPWLRSRYGIELEPYVADTIGELAIDVLPAELRGQASTRLTDAAASLGYELQPQLKLVRPSRAHPFDCGARCMLGCRCGAKWSAAEFVDDAVDAGAALRTGARVDRVLIEDGRAVGVGGSVAGAPFEARAATVVLAAGGIGTPRILQASGLPDAGRGVAMDVTTIVYGVGSGLGNGNEPPMTFSREDPEAGYMLSTLVDPWLLFPVMAALSGLRNVPTWARWNRLLGVMVKLGDDVSGGVLPDGTITKPLSHGERARLALGTDAATRILIAAGAEPGTIFTTPLRGTHPSATVRIGTMLDSDLQTEVERLYVCDASAFPEALGRPTVLTIVSLAKRLAARLTRAPRALARSQA